MKRRRVGSPGMFSQLVASSVGVAVVPMLAAASLAVAMPKDDDATKLNGRDILMDAKPELAVDVTRTRIAERIMDEQPLTMQFVGMELETDRFLVCEVSAYGEMDFSVWSIAGRQVTRLAQAEDIEGRWIEIRSACGKAIAEVAGTS